MTSIPYDPTLILGQVVELQRLKNLVLLADAQKPLDVAKQTMDNVIMTLYKMKMVHTEMTNLGVGEDKLKSFIKELAKVEDKISASAINYAKIALKVAKNVEALKNQFAQTEIDFSVESPIDFSRSEVTQFPLSFDSLNFDVQYVRNESNDQSSTSHAETVSNMSSNKSSDFIKGKKSNALAESAYKMALAQTSLHKIKGTIVITAHATHKNASIISPFILDPIKAVTAWNYQFPDDEIKTDPTSIMRAALDDYKTKPADKKSLKILSGCTKGSSFVGHVHILQIEGSQNTQSVSSYAKGVKSAQDYDGWFNASSGGYGNSKSFANEAKKLMSSSELTSHCSLTCEGIIPSIVANSVVTTVQSMDLDPAKIMENLATIQDAGNAGVNSTIESQSEEGKRGGQYMSLSSEHMKNSVSAITEIEHDNNKTLDTNSLMTAFEDYVGKAMDGESGVPINFYFKNLTKNDVAKAYIRKFYPSGVSTSKEAQRGQLGQEPAE